MRTREIAKLIDHAALAPTLTLPQLAAECKLAARYQVASICIKPCHVLAARDHLAGSGVEVGVVIAFPHGNSTVAVKEFECRQVLADGATEVDVVVNLGKVLEEDWAYVRDELARINRLCVDSGAICKVIFENVLLGDDKYKIQLCEICSDVRVAFVKTSTGYNFAKKDGRPDPNNGATDHDLILMRKHSAPHVGVKAAGGVRDLDALLRVVGLGVTRIGTKDTAIIMDEAIRRFGPI
jgi:deoxyribose-phosphate aldolase